MDAPILIPLAYIVSIGSPVIAALVGAIVYLAKAKDVAAKESAAAMAAAAAAAAAALRESEKGRLDDMRAGAAVVKETQERTLPVLERVAIELRTINERAAARAARRAADLPDSDHPSALRTSEIPGWVDSARDAARRAEEAAAEIRRHAETRGGTLFRGKTP